MLLTRPSSGSAYGSSLSWPWDFNSDSESSASKNGSSLKSKKFSAASENMSDRDPSSPAFGGGVSWSWLSTLEFTVNAHWIALKRDYLVKQPWHLAGMPAQCAHTAHNYQPFIDQQ